MSDAPATHAPAAAPMSPTAKDGTTGVSAFSELASTAHDQEFAAEAAKLAATLVAAPPPAPAATVVAPSPTPAKPAQAADATNCLPPPLPFSRMAFTAIMLLLLALTASAWHAMRATATLTLAVAAPPPAPPEAAPTAAQLADDTWFAAACHDHPERAEPLWRARANALAAAGDAAGALAAWDALARAARGDATLDDALGRAETLAELRRWDDALAALAKIDVADAAPPQQRRAIALDGRCRLARDRAGR